MNLFHSLSLKARVTLFTLAIFVISIWSLAFYANWMLHDDMESSLGRQQLSTVSFMAATINDEMESRLRALEKVASRISPSMMSITTRLQEYC